MIEELDDIILLCDLPENGLRAGDICTVFSSTKMEKVMKLNSLLWMEKRLQ
jgi:hypothetical protein